MVLLVDRNLRDQKERIFECIKCWTWLHFNCDNSSLCDILVFHDRYGWGLEDWHLMSTWGISAPQCSRYELKWWMISCFVLHHFCTYSSKEVVRSLLLSSWCPDVIRVPCLLGPFAEKRVPSSRHSCRGPTLLVTLLAGTCTTNNSLLSRILSYDFLSTFTFQHSIIILQQSFSSRP